MTGFLNEKTTGFRGGDPIENTPWRGWLPLATVRVTNETDRALQSKIDAGLDRLLYDIEHLEDAERWDGMS